jgi:hypothetical protein
VELPDPDFEDAIISHVKAFACWKVYSELQTPIAKSIYIPFLYGHLAFGFHPIPMISSVDFVMDAKVKMKYRTPIGV